MQSVYSVGKINAYIRNMFSQDYLLHNVSVKGEVSNCKYHSTGHIYFTLKDAEGTISCVLFSGNRQGLNFTLKDGQQVVVTGSIEVYVRDGKYQIYAKSISPEGEGALYAQFEELKKKLKEQGLFEEEFKREIPTFCRTIGIVTAPTGAAVRDIISISKRRNPYVQLILFPAIVQGENAGNSIIEGIYALEEYGVDLIIVGRGGGSLEDLWTFNEEEVAQAIFNSSVPIISAVGHETDFTIADFVADLRVPTPSAAAEKAVMEVEVLDRQIVEYSEYLLHRMQTKLNACNAKAQLLQARLNQKSPERNIRELRTRAMRMEELIEQLMEGTLQHKRHQLELFIQRIKGVSPLEKLNSGFSYVTKEDNRNLSSIHHVAVGDEIQIYMRNGKIRAKVLERVEMERGILTNGKG